MSVPFRATKLLPPDGDALYYSESFRRVIQDHLTYLKVEGCQEIPISPEIAQQYNFDLNGLLTYYRVPPQLHFACMLLNDMESPTEYRETMLSVKIAIPDIISRLLDRHRTVHRTV